MSTFTYTYNIEYIIIHEKIKLIAQYAFDRIVLELLFKLNYICDLISEIVM